MPMSDDGIISDFLGTADARLTRIETKRASSTPTGAHSPMAGEPGRCPVCLPSAH